MIIKKTARFIAVAALFLIPIFALIVANSFYFPFITGKAFYFRILVELAFAGWVILAFLDAKYRPKFTPLNIAVSLFALITLAADLLGVSPIRSLWSNFERMEGWMTIIHLWAMYMVATNVFGRGDEGKRTWHRFMNMELIVAVIVAGYGIGQLFGWFAIHQGSTRIDASLGNAAYMAVYMLINAGIAAYMFFVAKARAIANADILKWVYAILTALFAFEVFETATRGTILGLAGAIMLACFLYSVLGKKEKKSHRLYSAGVIVLIIVLAGALYSARNTNFVKNHEVLTRMANISLSDTQGQARSYIWPMALKGFTQRPILGWGQENFNYIFNANYNPVIWNQEQWFDRAHSVFLDWLVASGLVGLLAYLALYVLSVMGIWKSSLSLAEKSVLTGLLAGYAVHNFFVFDNLASYFLFFVVLAFINSLNSGKDIGWLSRKAFSAEAVEYVITPVTIVLLVGTLYFFNVRPIEANTRLIYALVACNSTQGDASQFKSALDVNAYVGNQEIREQLLSCAVSVINNQQLSAATKQGYYNLAVQGIDDQIKATPLKDARIYSLGGSFYDALAQFDKGGALLETAVKLSPGKQSIILEYANSLINQGKIDDAIAILGPAYLSAKNDTQVMNVYAVALIAGNQEAKAHELFGNDPAVFDSAGIAQAFMYAKNFTKAVAVYVKLNAANPTDMNIAVQLAQAQYRAGMFTASIATLRQIEKDHPEYKTQIEQAITQVQAGK